MTIYNLDFDHNVLKKVFTFQQIVKLCLQCCVDITDYLGNSLLRNYLEERANLFETSGRIQMHLQELDRNAYEDQYIQVSPVLLLTSTFKSFGSTSGRPKISYVDFRDRKTFGNGHPNLLLYLMTYMIKHVLILSKPQLTPSDAYKLFEIEREIFHELICKMRELISVTDLPFIVQDDVRTVYVKVAISDGIEGNEIVLLGETQ